MSETKQPGVRRYRVLGIDVFEAGGGPGTDATYELGAFDDLDDALLCAEAASAQPQMASPELRDRVVVQDRHAGRCVWERQGPSQAVLKADALAADVHSGQTRPDGMAYIEHPRAVLRAVLWDGMRFDEDIAVAALLHDTVEDQPERVAAALPPEVSDGAPTEPRARAVAALAALFGERVAGIVGRLSHAPMSSEPGEAADAFVQRKREHYAADVLDLFEEEDSGPLRIKLADLAQNALALHNVPAGPKRDALIAKYGPVVEGVTLRLEGLSSDDPRAPLRDTWLQRYRTRFPPRDAAR
jgi:hypothetical protein